MKGLVSLTVPRQQLAWTRAQEARQSLAECDLCCAFCITGAESWNPRAGKPFEPVELARQAVNAVAPAILWVDEIDKAFAGSQGSGGVRFQRSGGRQSAVQRG